MSVLYAGTGLSKTYGPQRALDRVDFSLQAGEVKGLVGANGAGKSTLLKILAGALPPDEGELQLEGERLALTSMRDAARRGIALVSQELNLFPALTIRENFALIGGRKPAGMSRQKRDKEAEAALADLGLFAPLGTRVERLSLGDRQLVEIARALLQNPRVLILDEPTSALHKREKDRLLALVKRLRARGVAIIYVSHFLEEVLEVADALVVLRDGRRVAADFTPSRDRLADVITAMLGTSLDQGAELPQAPKARKRAVQLSITNLLGPVQLDVPALTIASGEVVGVAGLAGAGMEELFAILFGRLTPKRGTVSLPSGKRLPRSRFEAVKSGVAYIPADRKRLGLLLRQTVTDNIASVRTLVQNRDGFFLRRKELDAFSRRRCHELGVKAASVHQTVEHLSGGNQQKIVFGKWLEADPSLVLLDDPTRGVDIGAKREMHRLIRQLAEEGRVVVIYSSDPLELVNVADRVHVFVNGTLREELSGTALTEHTLVSAMNLGARQRASA